MGDRHQFRAKWHDYNSGIFFITICTYDKGHILGRIVNSKFIPSNIGEIVKHCISEIPKIHPHTEVCNFVVMPNHIHMLLSIHMPPSISVGAQYIAPTPSTKNIGCLKPPKHGNPVDDYHFNSSLAVVIRTFKAAVTRMSRVKYDGDGSWRAQCIAPLRVWQRNYHEHIIRNQGAFDNIMHYIDSNVENWANDCFAK